MLSNLIRTIVVFFMVASPAFSKTVRYSEMSEGELEAFLKGGTGDIAEFQRGDIIRLKVKVSGEILESIASPSTKIYVKKGFFLKAEGEDLLLSWDNTEYLPIKDQIQGRLQVSASGDDVVSAVLIKLEANQQN